MSRGVGEARATRLVRGVWPRSVRCTGSCRYGRWWRIARKTSRSSAGDHPGIGQGVTRCPSRLIGHRACVRVHANHLEVRCRGALVAWPEPVRGEGLQGIDYRHVVHSLIRKPAAFRRQVCREAVFLSTVFRRAYDAVRGGGGAGLDARGRRGPGVRRHQGAYLGVAAAGRVRRCRR